MAKGPSSNYVVLRRRCCFTCTLVLVVSLASLILFWPSYPQLKIERLRVRKVKVHPLPPISADVYISVTVRVHNGDVYWMELTEVDVGVKYRGHKLGHVESEGWHVSSWGSSYVDGDLKFSGLPSADVAHLVEDLAKGRVYLRTVTEVSAQLGLLVFRLPLTFKTTLSCEVLVNTKNHTIVRQHCIHKD